MKTKTDKIKVVWDMETGDPDDFLTLLLLLGHPKVDLRAVTITPGTPHQVGLARKALDAFGRDIPVGAFNIDHRKNCVSFWHQRVFGEITPSREAAPGPRIMLENLDEETTLITGAPLKNLGAAIDLATKKKKTFRWRRWVAQGGFAGEGVVPGHFQLPKFKGRLTCPTYNFNGAPGAARAALDHADVGERRLVSKNVCHGVFYDRTLHEQTGRVKHRSLSLEMIWKGMEDYLSRKPEGKKFHDPLAACCAIDSSIGEWAEVELFRKKGEWGARLAPGSRTWILVDYHRERFWETLLAY